MKLIYKFLILITALYSCTKINELHGIESLKNKAKNLVINQSNSNDVINIIGQPQLKDLVNKNIWFYNEVKHTYNKLGTKETLENNTLKIEFDDLGVLKEITFLDKNNSNEVNYDKNVTQSLGKNENFLSNFLSSMRERAKKLGKTNEQ